ncbi:ribonucleotide reductase stimulatory protein [Spiroplasma clarkii]|uniref:Protein NrdI n=1 Tax=Spiroplasma clarkii TaxID=2139 RepID=A0A1Y0L0A0_9MOLU|nr:class Ib ribonucleoside-diphosphate reductase assembly flavoprotein NrdI [Spiroplasma clarkii]ARU91175.1 ribonucleotide reductase stimulatory protein [Spiroplasma clarkii]ATX70616.1 ribonucleotide reductase [Spiroplasma clarkii]
MHDDVIKVGADKVAKPTGKKHVVYFSSHSNNTHRFIEKLGIANSRIPIELDQELLVTQDYILIVPTYGGGGSDRKGAVPKQVIKFLNHEVNRSHCKGVVASGNTNFGDTFAIAGPIISKKLNVPMLYQFELLGTSQDVDNLYDIINNFWKGE